MTITWFHVLNDLNFAAPLFGNLTSSISVILSEFGAFSGGGGETRIIEKVSSFTLFGWNNENNLFAEQLHLCYAGWLKG